MHLCNAPLQQVWAESGGWSGLVGELITINLPEVVGICNIWRNPSINTRAPRPNTSLNVS